MMGAAMPRSIGFRVVLGAIAAVAIAAARDGRGAAAQTTATAQSSPAFDDEFERASRLLERREYFEALKGFQRANKVAGGRSAKCFLAMARAMQGMKVYQNAVDAAASAIEYGAGDARLLAQAHSIRGLALQALAEKDGERDAARLADAEQEFRAALAADPESNVRDLHYNLAVALMKQGRDGDGIAEMQRELEAWPVGSTAEEAKRLIENPRRTRETYAPEFSIVSSSKELIDLDTLKGRIVLLDFWATWCGPCVRALPSVKKLQKDHARDPFVLVGVSADRDEAAWRAFTDKNGMVWSQYWDRDHRMQRVFDVNAIPTYVLIDAEGIVRMRVSGSGFHEARALAAEIDRRIKLLQTDGR